MGWTIYNQSERVADPQAECDRLCTWNNEDSAARVLASAIVGSTYYAAVELEKRDQAPFVFAAVFLIQRSPFGYKDMDETCGPNECSPPLRVLEKLTPLQPGQGGYAIEWRRKAWARFGGEPQGQQVELAL